MLGLRNCARRLDADTRLAALAVFALALALRLAAVILMNLVYSRFIFAADSTVYDALARSLLAGSGYQVPDRAHIESIAPLFPVYLAGIYLVAGASVLAVGLANALIGSLTAVAVLLMGRKCLSPRSGLYGGLIMAAYPIQIFNTAYVLKDTLAIGLFAWTVYALLRAVAGGGWRWSLVSGILLALDTLTRYLMRGYLALALAVLAWYAWRNRWRWRRLALLSGTMLAGVALVLSPWVARATALGHSSQVTFEGIASSFYAGNGPGLQGETWGYYEAKGLDVSDPLLNQPVDPPRRQVERRYWQLAWQFISNRPLAFVGGLGAKIVNMWRPTWANSSPANVVVFGGSYVVMMALAVAGMWAGRRQGRWQAVLYSGALFIFLVHLVYYGMVRYRQFAEPFLITFAGLGLHWLLERLPLSAGVALKSASPTAPAGEGVRG